MAGAPVGVGRCERARPTDRSRRRAPELLPIAWRALEVYGCWSATMPFHPSNGRRPSAAPQRMRVGDNTGTAPPARSRVTSAIQASVLFLPAFPFVRRLSTRLSSAAR